MDYIIKRITDLNGVDKTDQKAKNRLNRVIKLSFDDIVINSPLFIECVYPGYHKSLITSKVKSYTIGNNELTITTANSIYHMEKCRVKTYCEA